MKYRVLFAGLFLGLGAQYAAAKDINAGAHYDWRGFFVGVAVVAQLLERHRLGRRKIRKSLAMGQHVHRDQQFQIIAQYREAFMRSDDPIVSMDTKAKEFLGLFWFFR